MNDVLALLVRDLERSIALLNAAAADSFEQRREFAVCLDWIYGLRNHRAKQLGGRYYGEAAACEDGLTTEGFLLLRGALAHEVTVGRGPSASRPRAGARPVSGQVDNSRRPASVETTSGDVLTA
jgi:hypothetical protein